jgi:flagellar basal body-associated protein FliL
MAKEEKPAEGAAEAPPKKSKKLLIIIIAQGSALHFLHHSMS